MFGSTGALSGIFYEEKIGDIAVRIYHEFGV